MQPRLSNLALWFVVPILSACVTINIYFPAAAAEKAADKIIDEVWQLQGKPPDKTVPPSSGQRGQVPEQQRGEPK